MHGKSSMDIFKNFNSFAVFAPILVADEASLLIEFTPIPINKEHDTASCVPLGYCMIA
ncbi:hypothetical protein GYMLUDRAFT_45078 [Collybiopsis luxurians FD-317 M1]|uniref:Uncharacterized protein n=1 Tax=Collybiopsis luxurians FD-317 M1 TaxID=944289 RepID=A0A0D0CSS5_9AGAR|nr:hypothetical protein GYMLUDRAFT_45078 [Collybiopsis luxurians FD-317 M1]